MRTINFLIALFAALSFTACKRPYVCECSKTNILSSSSPRVTTETYDLPESTPKNAERACRDMQVKMGDENKSMSYSCDVRGK